MRSDNVRVDKLLAIRKHPLLGHMGADVIERLANYAVSKVYKHGAVIFSKGDTGTSVFLVCVGAVKISVPSAGGRNAIFNIINEGEIFGEIAMLDGGTRTADACALTDCELLVIDRREFLPAIVSSSDAAMMLIRMLCSRLRRTSAQVEDTMFLDLPARLARMLLYSQDSAEPVHAGRKVELTRQEIGQTIGMSRESTNKQLRNWESKGWIRLERGAVVVLDVDLLTDIAEGDFGDT